MRSRPALAVRIIPRVIACAGSLAMSGCADWPRYDHKPSVSSDALSPGDSPKDGVKIAWNDPDLEDDSSGLDMESVGLQLMEGHVGVGILDGIGWDAGGVPDRISACDNPLAFPPDAPGTYIGDVDWIRITPEETGVLCLDLKASSSPESEEDVETARLDAVLYTLDDCGEPTSIFVHDGTADPIGADLPMGRVGWAIGVEAQSDLAIGLAGFWPDSDAIRVSWTASISLVPGIASAPGALCPELQ